MRRRWLFWLVLLMPIPRGADAVGRDIVLVRTECPPDSDETCLDPTKPCCFETLWQAANYVGSRSASNPALIDIGPGDFAQQHVQGPGDIPACASPHAEWDPQLCATFHCLGGHVTLRGAGRDRTRIVNTRDSGYADGAAIFADHDCEDLVVQDLTVASKSTGAWWEEGGGSSTWVDADVLGGVFGWYEVGTASPAWKQGIHYWYGCKLGTITPQNTRPYSGGLTGMQPLDNRTWTLHVAFLSFSSQSWFYGGEIFASGLQVPPNGAADTVGLAGVILSNNFQYTSQVGGDLRVFGSAIRVTGAPANAQGTLDAYNGYVASPALARNGMAGVFVSDHSAFHAHGANINVSASTTVHDHGTGLDAYVPLAQPGTTVNGLEVFEHGHAHAPGTSFVLNGTDGGTTRRIVDTGAPVSRVQAPTQWPAGDEPPTSPSDLNVTRQQVQSMHGQDTYVEVDCACSGNCNGGGQEPHLMVYSTACPGKWFDTVTGRCRGVVRPCPP